MDKNLKRKILLVTIIISVAIVFVPIYIFVLASPADNNKYTVINQKIVGMEDGTASFDADDSAGNDSSASNNRVRTFDKIKYTVQYTVTAKQGETPSSDIQGRKVSVEVLIPTTYEAVLKRGEETSINLDERGTSITRDGNTYYQGIFEAEISPAVLDAPATLDFSLENINSSDINTYNSIKPLVFIKESTDENTSTTDATCALETNVTDPTNCNVTITGVEDYFVNMYSGDKKTDDQDITRIPVGLLIGLRNVPGKGIKGSIIPKDLSFVITNSNTSKLGYIENAEYSYRTYQSTSDYKITIDANNTEMPEINNGTISGSINNDTLTITVNGIKDYLVTPYVENSDVQFYYFSTNYFLTTLAPRTSEDYSDITVTLTNNKNNSAGNPSSVQVVDSYEYILGNYSSNIDIYESSLVSSDSAEPLEYGKANINYGSDFTMRTNFDYTSRSNFTGDGLTSLTNYIKIDNDVFKLHNSTRNDSYKFIAGEITSTPSIKIETDDLAREQVFFGFGEWNSNYFEIKPNAPSGCPGSIDSLTKEQLMNLYGGPCIVEKNTVKWAYSPVSENDIDGNPITSDKGPLIVKSTYVAYDTPHIELSSSGTLELYGKVINDHTIANSTHQIVTSATANAKNSNDFRYLGNETLSGETILTQPNNFTKTNYDFGIRRVINNNNNMCSNAKCPASGATILISGVKVTKPVLKAHKASDLVNTASIFYYYPFALTVDAAASKGDDALTFDAVYVDIYLPTYMLIEDNYGVEYEKHYVDTFDTNLQAIYAKFDLGPTADTTSYKMYRYIYTVESGDLSDEEKANLQQGILSKFTVYADIDVVNTGGSEEPEIFTDVDFKASKHLLGNDNNTIDVEFKSIMPDADRMAELNNIILYNQSAVITKGSSKPKYIERNGSYTYNMFAYNQSRNAVQDGYVYPTADLYYILPYEGDTTSELSSKPGTTKYKVNFTSDSISAIQNRNDYKFYYATEGVPSNIIADEIKTTSDPSAIWQEWADPTQPVSNVIAVKVVKQSPFGLDTYFGSSSGLTINVQTTGSKDGNSFYNSFHLLTTKPANYSCDEIPEEPDYCTESRKIKANYSSSPSVTSVYAREISGFVFEDFDYNGIYTSNESKLKDIPVSLYKKESLPEDYDPIDPTTFVSEDDELVSETTTSETGSYYFSGLPSGIYYVSFTIDNKKYIVADLEKTDDTIPDSSSNNSSASLLPNTNRAISSPMEFPAESSSGRLIVSNINLGLNVKKEMALELNKYITEVTVTKNGKVETHDYSKQKLSKVSITVLNPRDTKVRVKYSFSVENTKYFPGYVGMIVDTMPKGMTFNPNLKENQYWVKYDNLLYYNGLGGKLLLPNETQYFSLVLDLDLKEAGTYKNVVSARDLTLMGEELPVYDFSGSNNEGGE